MARLPPRLSEVSTLSQKFDFEEEAAGEWKSGFKMHQAPGTSASPHIAEKVV